MLHAGPDDPDGPSPHPVAESAARWARFTFVVLFAMNLLDYMDRWILSAALPAVQKEFLIDNFWAGLLATFFLISYSVVSPAMGWLGDRTRRTYLLGIGVGVTRAWRLWEPALPATITSSSWRGVSWGSARQPTECSPQRS